MRLFLLMTKEKTRVNVFFLVASIFIWILVVSWIFIIFMLAVENGYESNERSYYIYLLIKNQIGIGVSEKILRAAAKVVEYGFLSFTIYLGMNYTNNISDKYSYATANKKTIKHDNELFIMYSFWLSSLAAVLDEYVQFYIDGRNPSVLDILISIGSICFVLLIVRIVFVAKLRIMKVDEIEY